MTININSDMKLMFHPLLKSDCSKFHAKIQKFSILFTLDIFWASFKTDAYSFSGDYNVAFKQCYTQSHLWINFLCKSE